MVLHIHCIDILILGSLNGRIIRTKVLYKDLVKVGESADGGDDIEFQIN
jgi:hypothetical protein